MSGGPLVRVTGLAPPAWSRKWGHSQGTDDLPSGREGTAERPSAPASPACLQLRTIPRPEGRPCPAGPPSAQRGQAGRGRLLGAVLQLHIRRAPQALGTMSRPQVFVQEERRALCPPPPSLTVCGLAGTDAGPKGTRAKVGVMACWGPWPGGPVLCPQLETVWWEVRASDPTPDCGRGAKGVSVRSRKGAPVPGWPLTLTQAPCGPRRIPDPSLIRR